VLKYLNFINPFVVMSFGSFGICHFFNFVGGIFYWTKLMKLTFCLKLKFFMVANDIHFQFTMILWILRGRRNSLINSLFGNSEFVVCEIWQTRWFKKSEKFSANSRVWTYSLSNTKFYDLPIRPFWVLRVIFVTLLLFNPQKWGVKSYIKQIIKLAAVRG
jgi:hypothetical protein